MESAESGGTCCLVWRMVMELRGWVRTFVESELFMYGSAQWLIPPWSTFSMRATRKISGWGHVTENTPCGDDENVTTSSMLNIYLTSELIYFNIKQKTHLGRGVVEQLFSHARDVGLSVGPE